MAKTTKVKPDCYKCKYRGEIPWNAHSRCMYPGTKCDSFDMFSNENLEMKKKLNIKGNPTGIKGDWFFWPINFDPVWLNRCDGFEEKE